MRPIMERRLAEAEAEAQEEPEEEELPEPELEPTVVSRRFDPAALAGLWRAFGTNVYGEAEEEFIQMDLSSGCAVTGMVDSDGDGVWTEEDCRIANGFFDPRTGQLKFDQIYDDNPSAEDLRTVRVFQLAFRLSFLPHFFGLIFG